MREGGPVARIFQPTYKISLESRPRLRTLPVIRSRHREGRLRCAGGYGNFFRSSCWPWRCRFWRRSRPAGLPVSPRPTRWPPWARPLSATTPAAGPAIRPTSPIKPAGTMPMTAPVRFVAWRMPVPRSTRRDTICDRTLSASAAGGRGRTSASELRDSRPADTLRLARRLRFPDFSKISTIGAARLRNGVIGECRVSWPLRQASGFF